MEVQCSHAAIELHLLSADGQTLLFLDDRLFTLCSQSSVSIGIAATCAAPEFGKQRVTTRIEIANLGLGNKKSSLTIARFSRLMSSEEAVWSVGIW
jgi:hypothetical protein